MKLPNFGQISVATKQVATKSAINPILWICGLTSPACIAAAVLTTSPLSYLFFGLSCVPIFYGLRAYEHFMKSDPDRLQSERFLIEREVVGKIGLNTEQGHQEIIIDSSGKLQNNPKLHGGNSQ